METKSAHPIGAQASGSPPRRRWYAAMTAVYLLVAGALAWFSRDSINPDGISYVQAARHYAAGRLDLAVNGWFGPMLSWLLVPACWLGVEPFLAARVLGVVYGVLFAWGTVRLARAIGGGRYALWAYGAALLISLRTVFAEVTPDFLMAAGLTWYFALAAEMIHSSSLRKAALAGLVGGACYYAKAYALPLVVAHLALTFVARWVALRKPAPGEAPGAPKMTLGRIAAPPILAMCVAVLLCAPWIAVISAQFGRFTTNTSASLSAQSWLSARSLVPRDVPSGTYPHFLLQRPRDGRITVWENPAEARGEWPAWPQGDLSDRARWQWQTFTFNVGEMATFFSKAEALGLLALGAIAAAALGMVGGGGALRPPHVKAALIGLAYLVILLGTVACLLPTFVYWTNDLLQLMGSASHSWKLSAFEAWAMGIVLGIPLTILAVTAARRSPGIPRVYWIWGGASAAIYVGGYLMLYLYERFLWGAWGIMIALLAGVLAHFASGPGPSHRPPGGKKKDGPGLLPPRGKTVATVLAAVVLVSIGVRLVERICYEAGNPMSESLMGAWYRRAGEAFPQRGQGAAVASNDWGRGLYFCYWSGSVYLGQWPPSFQSKEEYDGWLHDPARDLRPLSPMDVVVFESADHAGFADSLQRVPGFHPVGESRDPRSLWRLTELSFDAKTQAK
jgi:hypothetical protein